jgi:hypothetical protein
LDRGAKAAKRALPALLSQRRDTFVEKSQFLDISHQETTTPRPPARNTLHEEFRESRTRERAPCMRPRDF